MNKKLLCEALSMIDDAYIEENIVRSGADVHPSSGGNLNMNNGRHSAKSTKKIIAIAIAACLMLSLVVTASASGYLNIRSLFEKTGRDIPEQAYEYIVPQHESVQTEEWSCAVTETLCDLSEITIAIEVTCSDKYVLIPTDCGFNDPTGFIGIESDMTLGEYAASQDKYLMKVNVNLLDNELDISGGSLHFERVSDSRMVILAQATIESEVTSEKGVCTVHVTAPGVKETKKELTFTISEAPITSEMVYIPINPNVISGLIIKEAIITETPLGISISIEGTADDWERIVGLDLVCEEISGLTGGYERGDNGKWTVYRSQGQGELTDTLTVHVYDLETGEFIENIVFEQSK